MRTAIFLGLLSIAFAIKPPNEESKEKGMGCTIMLFIVLFFMDVIEFINSN